MEEVTGGEHSGFGARQRLWLPLVVAAGVVSAANYTNHASLIPILMPQFGVSAAAIGLLSTAMFVVAAALMIPVGHGADRFGAKPVITGGLALLAAVNLLAPLTYPGLLAAKAVEGGAMAGCFMGGIRYVDQVAPPARRHLAQGAFGAGMLLGTATGLYLTPWLLRWMAWEATFRLLGWATAAFALVWLVWARRPSPLGRRHGASPLSVVRGGRVWSLGWVHCAGFGMALVVGNWLPKLIVDRYGLPLDHAGVVAALSMVGALVARPVGGWLMGARNWSRRAIFVAGTGTAAAGLLVLAPGWIPLPVAGVAVGLLGFGTGMPYAAVFAGASAFYRELAGAAQGLVSMIATMFVVLVTPLAGWALERLGYGPTALALAALAVTATWTGWKIGEESDPHAIGQV